MFCFVLLVSYFLTSGVLHVRIISTASRPLLSTRMFSCLSVLAASRRILCARRLFAFPCTHANVRQVFNKGNMFALLSTRTAWMQKASKFHSMTLKGCGWLHQSSIPLPPPILMRNRTHQPWLNLPSVCLFFLSFAGLWFVCVFVVLYICLCKVAPWCQGPKFVEFYVRSNCSKALFHLTWQASDFWRRLTERQIAD